MTTTIIARVAAGAALLDRVRPGWEADIRLDDLNVLDCFACVLGQLYGNYGMGVCQMFDLMNDWEGPANYGFGGHGNIEDEFGKLRAAWAAEVTRRRNHVEGDA